MGLIDELIGMVAKPVFDFVTKHIKYVVCEKRLIKKLEKKTEMLKDKKEEIDLRVERALGEGKDIIPQVEKWLKRVPVCIDQANQFLDVEEKRINGDDKYGFNQCCCFIPNRYTTGNEAENLTITLSEELQEAELPSFLDVGVLPPPSTPPRMVLPPIAFSKGFDSRESLLEKIVEALKDKDMIGIHGMAGVGKTTLVNRLIAEVKRRKLFDEVGMAVVSRTPDNTVIRNEIADRILHKVLHANSESGKKDMLHGELEKLIHKQKKVLLVLDDAWKPLVLHEVGIPCPNAIFKIVVTSRFQSVCAKMDVIKSFEVHVLDELESWSLFRRSLKNNSDKLDSGEGYIDFAEEMIRHLNGLPHAIVTLAGALSGERLSVWRDAAKYLEERNLDKIDGMSDTVIRAIKLSFDYLPNRVAKEVFLLCCLFPEDWRINVDLLMKYGIGLGLWKDAAAVATIRDRVAGITEMLTSRSLLLQSHEEGTMVMMHDVTRDAALHIASEGEFNYLLKEYDGGKINTDKLSDKRVISLFIKITTGGVLVNSFRQDEGMEYRNLEILRLHGIGDTDTDTIGGHDHPFDQLSTCFFEGMGNLKVLEIHNMKISSFPESLGSLKNLRAMCLRYCTIEDISEAGELTNNLEILDLSNSRIWGGFYAAIRRLTGLRVLDLSSSDVVGFSPTWVGHLIRLECLYTLKMWDEPFLELTERSIDSYAVDGTSDELYLNESSKTPYTLKMWDEPFSEGLTEPSIDLYAVDETSDELYINEASETPIAAGLESLTGLEMLEVHCGISWLRGTHERLSLLGNLSYFSIWISNEKLSSYHSSYYSSYYSTKFAGSSRILFMYNVTVDKHVQQCLGQLFRRTYDASLIAVDGLSIMFRHGKEDYFPYLRSLQVINCKDVEFLISKQTMKPDQLRRHHYQPTPFAKLEHLSISELPELKAICAPTQHVNLSKLGTLLIEKCDVLPYVFTKSAARRLCQLKNMKLIGCGEMEEIFSIDNNNNNNNTCGGNSSSTEGVNCEIMDDSIVLPCLQSLTLEDAPKLKHFSAKSTSTHCAQSAFFEKVEMPELRTLHMLELAACGMLWESHLPKGSFSQLTELYITGCSELSYIFSAAVARGLMQLKELHITRCDRLEQVLLVAESRNDGAQEEESKITFPLVQTIQLYSLESLHSFCSSRSSVLEFPSLYEALIDNNVNMQRFSYGSLHTPKLTGLRYGDDLNTEVASKYI